MTSDDEHRAAVECTNCGAVGAARVRPDGTFEPLGQRALCSCEEPNLTSIDGDGVLDEDEYEAEDEERRY